MRIFVTGASGWIGSAVVPELIANGHDVIGLARSDAAAEAIAAAGAEVQRGSLEDLDSLRAGAQASDGVIHLGFIHDFDNWEHGMGVDRRAVDTFGDVLAGSDRPLVIASGVMGLAQGRPATEDDRPDGSLTRTATALAAHALADRGVRSVVVRFAPTVHGAGDHGFVAHLAEIARERGVAGYVGDGANRWPAVHRDDAARLVRLAVERAPAGSALHAVAEEGVPGREIAAALGRQLGLPTESIAPDRAAEHFGWMGMFFSLDAPAASAITRQTMGWEPTGPALIEDIDAGAYTREAQPSQA
jgi:nucleoside-diphosphate-sugar epimerase